MTTRDPKKYTYAIYKTQFHGGGLVSQHTTLYNAILAQKRIGKATDCVCGCAAVVDQDNKIIHWEADLNSTDYYITDTDDTPINDYTSDLYYGTVCS